MNLTPDAVKASPQWRADKAAADKAFTALRNFNAWHSREFKAELQRERRDRLAAFSPQIDPERLCND
jgi:hypothetical protein